MDFDTNKDYYKVLGVEKGASKDEINKAYRSLSKKYHPDVCKEADATEKFSAINEAHEVLADDNKRRQYDQMREMGGNPNFGGFGRGFGHMHRGFGMGGFDPFGDDNADYNTVKPKPSSEPQQGPVAKAVVNISFEESIYGIKGKEFKAEVLRECKHCHGTGGDSDWVKCDRCGGTGWIKSIRGPMVQITNCPHCDSKGWVKASHCEHCHGTGVVPEIHDFTVNVPRGAVNGSLLRLGGAGHNGLYNGPRGDIVVMVNVSQSDRFIADDDGVNLYTIHKISPITAIIGNENEDVVTPWGVCSVKIPKGCTNGTKLRLKGQGIPNRFNQGTYGDLYVVVQIDIPKNMTDKELKMLEGWAKKYEDSSLNGEINAARQRDKKYMDDIKARFDLKR